MIKTIMLLVTAILSACCLRIGIEYGDPLGYIFAVQAWLGYYLIFERGSNAHHH